jgi:hypothetical protein
VRDAEADVEDDSDQNFASDDDLIQDPEGEDPSAGLDGDQSADGNSAQASEHPPGFFPPEVRPPRDDGGDSPDNGDE